MVIKDKLKFIRFMLMIVLIIYILYKGFVALLVDDMTTYIVKYGEMYLEKEYSGVLIRNEKIFVADISGNIQYLVNEGDVVRKGQIVANIDVDTTQSNDENLKTELQLVEKDEILIGIENDISIIKNEITKAVSNNEVENIKELESKLQLKLELKDKLIGNNISNYNSEEFSHRNSLNKDENYFYSNYSGVVSRSFDGLEKKLTMANLYLINYNDILEKDFEYNGKVSGHIDKNENVYKIIDNYSFYIAYIVPIDELHLYESIREVRVEINGEEYTTNVYDSFENFSNGILILQFNEVFNNYYNIRKVESKITSDSFKGIEVYKDSIVTVDGVTGVYKLAVGEVINFVPVNVLSSSKEISIVEEGSFQVIENGEIKKYNSIKVSDEILRYGSDYSVNKF